MDFHQGERKGRYLCANNVSKGTNPGAGAMDRAAFDRALTSDEIAQLCKPIADIFHRCTCYDVMGLSTQVVVVEVDSPLTVAFIAAQETKVPQCVLWSATTRRFFGVLPTTEYIKILLYCNDHPEKKEEVTNMSISKWLEMTEDLSERPPVGAVVAAAPSDYLHDCFARMIRLKVRRSLLIADKDGNDVSLVGVLTQENVLQFLATALFSLETDNAAGTLGSDGDGSGPVLPPRVMNIVLGLSPGMDHSGDNVDSASVAVGPYRDILDVPFSQLPGLGVHRYSGKQNTVKMQTPVKDALRMLIEKKIHSVAVVDDYDIVIDVVSRSDVMRMETNGMYDVNITVAEALSFHVGVSIFVFHETDTVRDILIHFAQSKLRELYLVHPTTDKILGQLSMSEFLKFLFSGVVGSAST